MLVPHLGEICALLSAISWSYATILFRHAGKRAAPLTLNLCKNLIALALVGATLAVTRAMPDTSVGWGDRILLLCSGAIGIGLSDVLFFMTLNRVGAGWQAIIMTSYSPSIIILSLIFLHESLRPAQVSGVLLILCAVLVVSLASGSADATRRTPRASLRGGVLLGLLATSSQAVSVVMIKPVLESLPLLWVSAWRLVGGVVASILLYAALPDHRGQRTILTSPREWMLLVPGTVVGSYVSLLFWLGGMKYTQASTASALNQTATLWTLLLATLLLREPITRHKAVAFGIGAAGVALVSLG